MFIKISYNPNQINHNVKLLNKFSLLYQINVLDLKYLINSLIKYHKLSNFYKL